VKQGGGNGVKRKAKELNLNLCGERKKRERKKYEPRKKKGETSETRKGIH